MVPLFLLRGRTRIRITYGYYGSSARLQVKPRHAEVFIDGYFVGTVDDFDGWSQRLNVEPGEHELIIYLAGHRTYRQPVLFRPGATIKIEHVMQPLAAGDPDEGRPQPPQSPSRPPIGATTTNSPRRRAAACRHPAATRSHRTTAASRFVSSRWMRK